MPSSPLSEPVLFPPSDEMPAVTSPTRTLPPAFNAAGQLPLTIEGLLRKNDQNTAVVRRARPHQVRIAQARQASNRWLGCAPRQAYRDRCRDLPIQHLNEMIRRYDFRAGFSQGYLLILQGIAPRT